MKKKSLALAAIAVLMVASLATALTLAYFTDTKTATNVFTVGNVEIKLDEPSWPTDEETGANVPVNILPGVAVDKDPFVTNTGDNDAYVRVLVQISNAEQIQAIAVANGYEDSLAGVSAYLGDAPAGYGFFLGGNAANTGAAAGSWVVAGMTEDTATNSFIVEARFDAVLVAGAFTNYVFTGVKLPAYLGNAAMATLEGLTITVTAEAIQAEGFDNAADAFTALNTHGAEAA